jgi:hypothetical protein
MSLYWSPREARVSEGVTSYPGVGADEAIDELHRLVGEITSEWAGVEDQLFRIFVVALAGAFHIDLRPYRAVFFTFSSYEGKMRMTNNAVRARYAENEEILTRWAALRKDLNAFSNLRNEIAHLSPAAIYSTDPAAKANVRLLPPFWKSAFTASDFDKVGYNQSELLQALAPFRGWDPRISLNPPAGDAADSLGYRLERFAMELLPPFVPRPTDPTAT